MPLPPPRSAPTSRPDRAHGLLRELLGEGRAVELRVGGSSMSPFVRTDDVLTVSPPGGGSGTARPVCLGDVVAVPRGSSRLSLHRVVEIDDAILRTRGDAAPEADPPTARGEVLGIVTRQTRRGRPIRFGWGRERAWIARLSARGWLPRLTRPWRRSARAGAWLARAWRRPLPRRR